MGWRGVVIGLAATLVIVGSAQAQNPQNQAALVVMHGDGSVSQQCVAFSEPEISGYALLEKAGLDIGVEATAMGNAVCRLDGEGCNYPQETCFCQCQGTPCKYWSYWQQAEGAWEYSALGGSSTTVRNGDVQGWVWGTGVIGQNADLEPPAATFAEICAAATATSTATDTPTETPAATPTETPSPTPTFTPETPTATFTPLPTATLTPLPGPAAASPALAPPVIRAFAADRTVINYGETMMLEWDVAGADTVALRSPGGEEMLPPQGTKAITPPESTTFTLVARGPGGEASAGVQVVVNPVAAAPAALPTEAPTAELHTAGDADVDAGSTAGCNAAAVETATAIAPVVLPVTASQDVTTSQVVTIVITAAPVISEEVALAQAAPEVNVELLPAVAGEREAAETARTQRLLLTAGLGFVLGAPLVFGGIWFIVWSIWRRR